MGIFHTDEILPSFYMPYRKRQWEQKHGQLISVKLIDNHLQLN